MRSISTPSLGETFIDKFKPIEGGLGTSSAPEALIALDAVPSILVDQPYGIASLDTNKRINIIVMPLDNLSTDAVEGPTTIVAGSYNTYVINNYDVFVTYTLSAAVGTISIVDNIITYLAPTVAGNYSFVLNDRVYNVLVVQNKVLTPVIAVTDAPGGAATLNVTGSSFVMLGTVDIHSSSDWQIAIDVNFSTIVASSNSNTVNKTSYTNSTLSLNTVYFVRARYRGASGYISDWSNIVMLVTKVSYALSIEEAKTVASDKAANDRFGQALSMSQDGSRLAIGAYTADSPSVDCGAVYIFARSGNSWTQEAKLVATDRAAGDYFGVSVSINGDGSRIAVAASSNDSGAVDTGAVYVFKRTGSIWDQEAKLTASDKVAYDNFGTSVRITGDASRIVIGAPLADVGAANTGAVYIFTRLGTVWTQEAKLVASDRAANDVLGNSVSITDDGSRVAVGAPMASVGVLNSGALYVFSRVGTVWTQEAKLVATDKASTDKLGTSVSINSDGSKLVTGASTADQGAFVDAGAVYIFSRQGTNWTQDVKLTALDKAANDFLGFSVSMNATGTRVAVGAYGADTVAADTGAVYIFVFSNNAWVQEAKLTASDKAATDYFGYAVSMTGDSTRVAVGSYLSNPGGIADAGAAYIYRA